MKRLAPFTIVILLLVAACASGGVQLPETGGGANELPILTTQWSTAPSGELPPFFDILVEKAAQALGASREELIVDSFNAVEWGDACLGAARAGEACAQGSTPGYQAILGTPQGKIALHTDRNGENFRLIFPDGSILSAGKSSFVTPGEAGDGGIRGQAQLGPACPGPVSADRPCPDAPYQTSLTVLDESGVTVAQIQTDAQGNFEVALPPGVYTLHPESNGRFPYAADQVVQVEAGEYTPVQVQFESGMR